MKCIINVDDLVQIARSDRPPKVDVSADLSRPRRPRQQLGRSAHQLVGYSVLSTINTSNQLLRSQRVIKIQELFKHTGRLVTSGHALWDCSSGQAKHILRYEQWSKVNIFPFVFFMKIRCSNSIDTTEIKLRAHVQICGTI